jgi:hypothetical protein
VDYLTNVSARRPIHDAIRLRAKLNEERLKMPTLGSPDSASDVLMTSIKANSSLGLLSDDDFPIPDPLDFDSFGSDEGGLAEGSGVDTLDYIPVEDLKLLVDEIYRESAGRHQNKNDEIVRGWFKVRKETSPAKIFQSIPEAERTLWSPWYLKDTLRK